MKNKLIILILLLGLVSLFFIFEGDRYLSFSAVQENKAVLLNFVEQQLVLAVLLATFVYIVTVSLSLPGASLLSLLVGFLFGRWLGWSILLVAATIGATVIFLLARYLFSQWARTKLAGVKVAQTIIDEVDHHALNYLLFLRLVPLFPFWLVNLSMAFTKIDTKTYMAGTFFGIIPGSFVFANLGQSLATIEQPEQIFSIEMILALVLLGVLMLLPVIIKHFKTAQ